LLRHATTEGFRPGFPDRDRRLTEAGQAEAARLGDWLREQAIGVEQVLCSTAVRTRQTLAGLGLAAPAEFSDPLYGGGTDTILEELRLLDDGIGTALLIGHAPAVPSAVHELADPTVSDPAAVRAVARGYPPATLSLLEFTGPWAD